MAQAASQKQALKTLKGKNGADDYLAYDYENDEPTDEARTNEEGYEEMLQQQFGTTKYGEFPGGNIKMQNGKCVFFNDGGDEEED